MIRQGRVVRIFDDEKIAINLGSRDGLTSGTRIEIYSPQVEIEDPETGESLGTYRHLKAIARASDVAERFTIAGPYPRRERVAMRGPLAVLGQTPTQTKTVPGELPVNEFEADPLPGGNEIRLGDIVEIELEDSSPAPSVDAQEAANEGG
ncbi:MAG TPA: hypothetical protein VEB65_02340 [Solirubrobacterales bacterium]|nr:hypothetical protein [Solirubrobacterales bacterium]